MSYERRPHSPTRESARCSAGLEEGRVGEWRSRRRRLESCGAPQHRLARAARLLLQRRQRRHADDVRARNVEPPALAALAAIAARAALAAIAKLARPLALAAPRIEHAAERHLLARAQRRALEERKRRGGEKRSDGEKREAVSRRADLACALDAQRLRADVA